MTQFYFRHGAALSEADNARVIVGVRGDSGQLDRDENCPRCSGQGGSAHWRPDGGVCYQCRGKATIAKAYRVYTAKKLAHLVSNDEKRAAKKQAEQDQKAERAYQMFITWAEPRANLVTRISAAQGNSFLADLTSKLRRHVVLTDKQMDAAERALDRDENRAQENAASEWVGEVKERRELEVEVLGVYGTDGVYGHTDIVKMKDLDGNLFTWFASDYTDLERGDRLSITGTVKKHDEYKGTKQTVITRCRYEKFKVLTPTQAANAEAVV